MVSTASAPFVTSPRPRASLSPWWFVPLAAALLFLRKPWALHTPQLYAEDGSVFLVQDEQLGVAAWWVPYNGYLHLLPRLIAWIASHTVDPGRWPAVYNGLAFAIAVGVFARLASARIDLPVRAKPWLLAAFAGVVSSGEVLINATNLQWLTAFFLLLQLFAAPATRGWQRILDVALLLVVGLNGPFALVFLPLFAWRAWRARSADTLASLLAVATCAAVQLSFFVRTAATVTIDGTQPPVQPLAFAAVLGSRLVTWPLLGPRVAQATAPWLHAALGAALLLPFLGWTLRAAPLRATRALLVTAFVLITAACSLRVRADTLSPADMINGDRYFYISRVLLAWLLILEFDAAPRWLGRTARALAALAVLSHLPHFVLPAPIDYEWPRNAEPIRRGIPANIPTLPEGWWIEYPGRSAPR